MDAVELTKRRDEIVARYGPWIAVNVDLGHGVYTMGPGIGGVVYDRVGRILQLVSDFAARPLNQLRILDLGAHEGIFAIAFAQRGAEVVAVEARETHVAKAAFVKEMLNLNTLSVVQGNVREVTKLVDGPFDVVLCLGLLYHLDSQGVFDLVSQIRNLTQNFAIIETNVSLSRTTRVEHDGNEYMGRMYGENTWQRGASVDSSHSYWPTKASLLNILADTGFTSVCECLNPVIPDFAIYRDHVTLIASASKPVVDDTLTMRWPERLPLAAHPTQGMRWAFLDKIRSRRGGGLASVFTRRQAHNENGESH